MAAKAGLDKGSAAAVEDKATKELAERAKQEKKKDDTKAEVARNPELPQEEKLDAKDVANVLAPPKKEEEKAAEKPHDKKEDEQGKEAKADEKADGGKKKEDEQKADAETPEGVKKVEDPAKKDKKAEKKAEAPKVEELAPKDKLVVDGAKADTADKRALGDIFFVASLASLASADRALLERNCKEEADRSYTVTFYEKDPESEGGYKPIEINIQPDFAGPETDGAEGKSKDEGKSDRLMATIKQAYTKWKGGEDKLGEGKGGEAMEALTGQNAQHVPAEKSDAESVWSKMVEACTYNQPLFASTRAEETKALFSDSDVKPFHAYIVLKCKEVNGKRMVTLRNPFGKAGVMAGNTIEVELQKFVKLYRGVTIGSTLPEKEPKGGKEKQAKKQDTAEARA